jgi:CubicO group peptidase (beta-lactamase class C family)
MRAFIRTAFGIVTATVLWASRAPAQTTEVSARYGGVLDTLVARELHELGGAGVAVAVVKDDVVYARGFGVRDVESGVPVTPDMLFHVGSVTKMFTAALLLELADEGKIDLDAPVARYLPWAAAKIGTIHVRQLLTHTAGLRDAFAPQPMYDPAALERQCRSLVDSSAFIGPAAPTGASWSYSNIGYALAGCVAEAVGKKPYAVLLAERILTPVGMTRSTINPFEAVTSSFALGHDWTPSGPRLRRAYGAADAQAPAGELITSVNELARFMIALMHGGRIEGRQAIPAGVVGRLLRPEVAALYSRTTDPAFYGYGLFHREWRGVTIVEHPGRFAGFAAGAVMVPSRRFALIVAANTTGIYLQDTERRLLELELGLPPAATAQVTQAASGSGLELDAAGTYGFAPNRIQLTASEGRLHFQQDTVTRVLTRVRRDVYSVPQPPGFSRGEPMALYILRDSAGRPTAISYFNRTRPRVIEKP